MHAERPIETRELTHDAHDVKRTTRCIVGGGPAGGVLGLLLARSGVNVTLLEGHLDFDREFRGDTIHPSVMEIMDQLGLAEQLLELRHTKVRSATVQTVAGPFTPLDFSPLKTKYPYITMMPQTSFLEFITAEETVPELPSVDGSAGSGSSSRRTAWSGVSATNVRMGGARCWQCSLWGADGAEAG